MATNIRAMDMMIIAMDITATGIVTDEDMITGMTVAMIAATVIIIAVNQRVSLREAA
ncbi:MAG: hypothetical protein H0X66_21740 [Verrucomicrobia bacterium]|nr:hypothetical protein [Verrucomicrobiota bacterium]